MHGNYKTRYEGDIIRIYAVKGMHLFMMCIMYVVKPVRGGQVLMGVEKEGGRG